jgi:hypothetical protein
VSLDRLGQATQALRQTTLDDASRSNAAALGRVLERLERPKPPSRLSMRHVRIAAWTLAASLLGVGAWANVTGRVSWFVPEPASAPPERAPAPAPAAARERPRRQAPASEAMVEPAPAEAPEAALAPPVEPALEPPAVAAPVAPSAAAPMAPPRPAPEPGDHLRLRRAPAVETRAPAPDADELYRAAHQAHFGRADYAAALALWDRYLAQAEPGHRWKIEARYNRGIALYRLGQTPLAREALEPFARGEYGGYRRAEAQRLLEAAARSE